MVVATGQDAAVDLEWTVPTSSLPVTSQQIKYRKTGSPTWVDFTGNIDVNGTTATATVDGLDNGDAYEFQVIATNIVGDSEPQDPAISAAPFQLPGMIDSVEARNIGADVYLDWSDPPPGDGATIVDHLVQYKLAVMTTNHGRHTEIQGRQILLSYLTGLANLVVGQTYVFRVAYLLNVVDKMIAYWAHTHNQIHSRLAQ